MAMCQRLGCVEKAVSRGRCPQHATNVIPPEKPRERPEWDHLYNTTWWRKIRVSLLQQQPLCIACSYYGHTQAAIDVDHIVAHRGNTSLFYSAANLQPLCKSHHSMKTSRERYNEYYDYRRGLVLDSNGAAMKNIK